MVSGVNSQLGRHKEKIMATDQITMSETIAKAVAEATRAAIQAMAAAAAERPQRTQEMQTCHEGAHIQLGERRQI